MRRILPALIILLALAATAPACLWDSDTLRAEARGLPGLVEIITGRIDRPPPLYYKMRLERVTKAIAQNPADLAAYDDAGVACDRLGRGDEAIAWMARKKEQIDRLGPAVTSDDRYRYEANLGTFLAHRWARAGAKRDDMADLRAGREHIAEAIRINPQAHFGREKYQLLAIDWIIAAPENDEPAPAHLFQADPAIDAEVSSAAQQQAVEGLAGLIALGNAWESFDVFYALSVALERRGDSYLAHLARGRCREILESGGRSLHPGNPLQGGGWSKDQSLVDRLHEPPRGSRHLQPNDPDELDSFYHKARAEADLWRKERHEFMLARLQAGKHPDTDSNFWTGYTERPAPTPPGSLLIQADRTVQNHPELVLLLPTAAGVVILVLLRWVKRRLRRAQA